MQRVPAHIHRYDPPIAGIEIIYEAVPRPTSPYDSTWMMAGAYTRPLFSST